MGSPYKLFVCKSGKPLHTELERDSMETREKKAQKTEKEEKDNEKMPKGERI